MTSRRTLPAAGAALLLATALSGCALFGSDDPAPTSTTAAPTTTTTAAPVARTEPPELLDPGKEPRQALRVALTEGDTAEVTFTSDLAITQESAGRTQRLDSPPVSQVLTYTVGTVTDAGAELTVRIDAIAAKGKGTGKTEEQLAAIDDELAPLVGLEATGTVTPLGEVEDLAFDAPGGLSDALESQLDALAEQLPALGPALPAEEVGVGASWRTTATTSAGGAEAESVTTYTVTAIEDGTVSYTSTIRSTADPQDLALAGLPKGSTARLESSDLRGSATGTMRLDAVGVTLRTRLSGTQQLTVTSEGGSTDLAQAIEIAYAATTASD